MAKRGIPEINASSQADIAFLLLIFYLVSTTMNVDSGIQRMLPPWIEQTTQDANKINERNIMKVSVSSQDKLLIGDQWADITQLKEKVKEFIVNPTNAENLPEKEMTEIDIIGEYPVSKGVISLQNTRETSYNMYVTVQNELSRAVRELRDDLSMQKFGKKFSDLEGDQMKAITKAIPTQISEAEPRDMTKK
ncbi:MAG: biopolymer transporter ExbD [Rikenellaceae bacterium]